MRYILLATTIFVASCAAPTSGWQWTADSKDAVSYADPSTIVRTGSTVKMLSMSDYREEQTWGGYKFFSSRAEIEYDCVQPRSRIIVENGHAGHMATGAATYAVQGPRAWLPVDEGTIASSRRDIACGR